VEQLFPFILLALAILLLFVLPARQRKRAQQQQQDLQNSLTIGTPVMTTAGLHGTVAGLHEKTVELEIAPGVVVTFARPAVMEVRRPAVDSPAPGDDNPGAPGTPGTPGTTP
jgi:preprotein translocase subunit YajC